MNYEKLSGSIRAVIDRRPGDNGAYSDLFSLCREWETEDFSAAHKVNRELLALSADQVVRGGGAKFYEQWRRCLLFEAPHDFDSFMTYIELDRKPEKRFYACLLYTSSMTEPTVMGIACLMTFSTICWIRALTRRQKVEYI